MTTQNLVSQLALDLEQRIKALPNQSVAAELKQADPLDVIETASSYVVMGIRKEATMVNMIADIGLRVRDKIGLKRDSIRAARIGAFVLESFETHQVIKRELESNGKNQAYYVQSDDDSKLSDLWELLPLEKSDHTPNLQPVADWSSGVHETGLPLVRHAPRNVLNRFNVVDHGMIFDVLNKQQNTGWNINKDVLKVFVKASNHKELAEFDGSYAFKFLNPEEPRKARSSMRLEANTIKALAKKVKNETFYHMYDLDFRGRVYPHTAFLHEQGSDNAKGLLLLATGVPLGSSGLKWLGIHAANSFGEDKLPLIERMSWSLDRVDEFITIANDPFANRQWMKADKPWSFLACCFEFKKWNDWIQAGNNSDDFVSHLPVFIDGSCNGLQHLAALALDETVAPLVNLVPQDTPGDLYTHVAEIAWQYIEKDYDPKYDEKFEEIFARICTIGDKFNQDRKIKKEEFDGYVAEAKELREELSDDIKVTSANYWMQIEKAKHRRTTCKRPCMTLGYGGTKYGFKTQVLEDTRQINRHFRNMQYVWANYMGELIYDVCRGNENRGIEAALPGPAKMLTLFETLAERAVDNGRKFQWKVPVTNFPVIQQYRRPKTKRIEIDYLGNRLQLTIRIMEDQEIKRSKQITAASPNVIHSFDAAHLVMVASACSFETPTVHDSFGCHAGNMNDLFWEVRNQFVVFYNKDPLRDLLVQQDALDLMPERGSLNIEDIRQSDFAFA